jgi:hypothetical protein
VSHLVPNSTAEKVCLDKRDDNHKFLQIQIGIRMAIVLSASCKIMIFLLSSYDLLQMSKEILANFL